MHGFSLIFSCSIVEGFKLGFISEGGVNEEIVGVETKDVAVPSHQEVLKKYFKVSALLSLEVSYSI